MPTSDKLAEILTEQERVIIWAALDKYDTGPEEANPRLYKKLEECRKRLMRLFE